jgi:hypothetical protein
MCGVIRESITSYLARAQMQIKKLQKTWAVHHEKIRPMGNSNTVNRRRPTQVQVHIVASSQ